MRMRKGIERKRSCRMRKGKLGRVLARGQLRDARHREITSRVSHARVGGGTDSVHSLSALAQGPNQPAGICLVSLFMRFNIVIWHRLGVSVIHVRIYIYVSIISLFSRCNSFRWSFNFRRFEEWARSTQNFPVSSP